MSKSSAWPSTHHSLLVRIANRADGQSWEVFTCTYAPLIFRYARRKGLQEVDAEDVTQNVLLKMKGFEYQPDKGRFRSWLATVAWREIRDQRNRSQRKPMGHAGDLLARTSRSRRR